MAEDRVHRFLSKEDWTSLFVRKPQKEKQQRYRALVKRVKFEDMVDKDNTSPSHADDDIDLQSKLQELEARKAHYAAFRQRLDVLSKPKQTRLNATTDDDIQVGPADYDTRLDIAKPTFLSTRPNQPIPRIKRSAIGRRLTSPGRTAVDYLRYNNDARSDTLTVLSSEKQPQKRSVSLCKERSRKQKKTFGGSFGARKWSLGKEQERGLEFMGVAILPDIRNYTPTPVPSKKFNYSIPKSQKSFNIKKCKNHSDSQLNQRFNSMFV